MPKPILNPSQVKNLTESVLSATPKQRPQHMDKLKLDRLLRKTRSKEYMDAIHRLDAGGRVHNREKAEELITTIRNELPEVEIEDVLLGIVAICYLGKPYEVHTLDVAGKILSHYKSGEPLPPLLEPARGIALHGGYDFIEIYVDCFRCVSSIGTVSVIKR
ncbi:MAG: hypothetical protein Q4C01_05215 [Clostridia bacterium]|nr:hypothetical protein [Clostridia bacterium]